MNTVSLFAATVLLGITTLGSAAEMPVRSVAVRYADLNLARSEGAQQLYARIRSAARDVCPERSEESVLNAMKVAVCRREAIEAAIASVDSPLLTAVHLQAGGSAQRQVAGGIVLR